MRNPKKKLTLTRKKVAGQNSTFDILLLTVKERVSNDFDVR